MALVGAFLEYFRNTPVYDYLREFVDAITAIEEESPIIESKNLAWPFKILKDEVFTNFPLPEKMVQEDNVEKLVEQIEISTHIFEKQIERIQNFAIQTFTYYVDDTIDI